MHRFLDYARLVRLPNVFTAMADVVLGALAVGAIPDRLLPVLWLLLASSCLYCSGMVWNDVFDLAEDRRDRPFRPLACGRIAVPTAIVLGCILMMGGVAAAWLADQALGGRWQGAILAILLVAAIFLYDGYLKRTWLGPIGMGTCRFLNVHLGLAAAGVWPEFWGWVLALVVGLYIVGLTWFARTETEQSSQVTLGVGAGLMLGALVLALTVPALLQYYVTLPPTSWLYPYLLVAFGFFVGTALYRAWRKPGAAQVQAAVKRAIMGLILLDAALATAFVGLVGLLVALLLVPAWFMGRWVYST